MAPPLLRAMRRRCFRGILALTAVWLVHLVPGAAAAGSHAGSAHLGLDDTAELYATTFEEAASRLPPVQTIPTPGPTMSALTVLLAIGLNSILICGPRQNC